jgi:hypothetical protein
MQSVLFRITLPRDCDLAPALRQIAERIAQTAGYASTEAARIGTSVGQAADAVMADLVGASQLDVTIERNRENLDVWLRYPVAPVGRPPAAVDAALSSEALRQGMDSVEFGNEDGVAYCRLRRALPHSVTPEP